MPARGEPDGAPAVRPSLPAWLLPALVAGLAIVVGLAPLGMAMGVVLLCAGPHNWCEARYFVSRMPRRWGRLRTYFLTAASGVAVLTLAFIALAAWSRRAADLAPDGIDVALAVWHTAAIAWVATLVALRRREAVRGDAGWVPPLALLAIAAAWVAPTWVSVAVVYAHPVLALLFLDRELVTRRAHWQGRYRNALALVPLAIAGLWLLPWHAGMGQCREVERLRDRLPTANRTSDICAGSEAVTHTPEALQAGTFLLPTTLATPLLATHVFLESLHYGVWIVGIPLATTALPWHVRAVPLAAPSSPWRAVVRSGLVVGGLAVVALWVLFAIDYETTRQVYFTVAVAHVLAEVPFLIRVL